MHVLEVMTFFNMDDIILSSSFFLSFFLRNAAEQLWLGLVFIPLVLEGVPQPVISTVTCYILGSMITARNGIRPHTVISLRFMTSLPLKTVFLCPALKWAERSADQKAWWWRHRVIDGNHTLLVKVGGLLWKPEVYFRLNGPRRPTHRSQSQR